MKTQEETFILKTEFIELLKLIKVMQWANSGGEGKLLVDDGLIQLNGTVESRYRAKLRMGDIVEFEGKKVFIASK